MPLATPPHAYVVEARPLDACRPPACGLVSSHLDRDADPSAVREATDAGYVTIGSDKNELFAKRAAIVPAGETFAFDLDPSDAPSVFDAYVGAATPGEFHARVELGDRSRDVHGTTAPFAPHDTVATLGHEEAYFTHVREPLPSRSGRRLHVAVTNLGTTPLALGAPLVLRRVEGRAPRQAVFVFFDAVPHPLLAQLFTSSGDAGSAWVARWVEDRGLLFSHGISPGQLTGSFVRRFFKGEFYRLDGDRSLRGQGFDETPPERIPGPIARLAEQGFVTQAIGSNLYLSPLLSRIGFDGEYNVESSLPLQIHPPVLARRFDAWLAEHAEDDAAIVVWFASTHAPWREGRRDAPEVRYEPLRSDALDHGVLDPIWRNLLEGADALRDVHASAAARSPGADRVWLVGTDHGHTFTQKDRARPWRLTNETVERDHWHCCLGTQQETRTPFVLLFEGRDPPARGAIDAPTSTFVAWRAVEDRFGVRLDLPDTSTFDGPPAPEERVRARFDDRVLVSVGDSGTLSAIRGTLEYRSYAPALALEPAWSVSPKVALLLEGAVARDGEVVSEELYDLATDPAEEDDVASRRFDELLAMRRDVADWLAVHGDTPDHPRFSHRLVGAAPGELRIEAPRAFALRVDAKDVPSSDRIVTVRGAAFELADGDEPIGVVALSGSAAPPGTVVRCASSGLPLAVVAPGEPPLDLALAATNCPPAPSAPLAVAPGELAYSAEPLARRGGRTSSGGTLPALRDALRRWGYVRDK